MRYSRDLRGYGETPPDPRWPGGARIAVQIVVNYEEGGENSIELALTGLMPPEMELDALDGIAALMESGDPRWR